MSKPSMDYFESQYRLAYLDYITAVTEHCRDEALDDMARVYNTVVALYGSSAADDMQTRLS